MSRRKSTLGTFTFPAEFLEGSAVTSDVDLILALDELDEVVHGPVVKVFSSQMSVSTGRNDLSQECNSDVEWQTLWT